jgi:hypothetical protein
MRALKNGSKTELQLHILMYDDTDLYKTYKLVNFLCKNNVCVLKWNNSIKNNEVFLRGSI